jgi:hypothetical protein
MANLLFEAEKKYSVFQITNSNPGSKNYGKKIFIVSSYMKEEDILSRIRSMQDSKTGRGGTKDLAQDIKGAGKDYKEDFSVKTIRSGLTKANAEAVKSRFVDKAGKVYNQSQAVV